MMKKSKTSNSGDARAKVGTLIGKGAIFDGDLSAPETVCIDGTLNGNCDCKEQLIVGIDGQIKGDITAQSVLISGKVEGDIVANGKIELLSTGKIVGNISAKSLVIDEDACFDGRCTMTAESSTYTANNKTADDADKQNKDNASGESTDNNNKDNNNNYKKK
ncbi:MAG: polymer-forming cytoskeletal protein [Muribaculaceae bacterium]|nr:polymer-forming cytoskeletal protein [Muribaculaceae bacterium]